MQLQNQFKNMLSRNFAESLYSNNNNGGQSHNNYDLNGQQHHQHHQQQQHQHQQHQQHSSSLLSYNNFFAVSQQQHSAILKNQLRSKQPKKSIPGLQTPLHPLQTPISKISNTNKL